MKTRWLTGPFTAIVVGVLAGTVLTAPTYASTPPAPKPAKSLPTNPLANCQFTRTPDLPPAKPVLPPLPLALKHGSVGVKLWTNYGTVTMRLNRDNAPCAVHNFAHLVLSRFYDRTQCWRLTNSARLGVLQCGDIFAAEKGGPGYKFDDEVTGRETYPRGTVAMGNQGPGTNGSQFFVVHSFANIKPMYTVLGQVTDGMAVLDKIVAAGIKPGEGGPLDGLPAKPVKIHRATFC